MNCAVPPALSPSVVHLCSSCATARKLQPKAAFSLSRQLSILISTFLDTPRRRLTRRQYIQQFTGAPGNVALASELRYLDLAQQQRVQDFHRRYAVAAHASRGRNPRRTLDCRAWHDLEKRKP